MSSSASKERVRRVYAATKALLDDLHKDSGEQWVWRFRRRFIAPASLFESGAHVLEDMEMHKSDALLFSLVPGITRYMRIEAFGKSPRLNTFGKASEYLKGVLLGRTFEHFYMLALDASGKLIDCVFLQRGTTDSAPFYVRHVLGEVVRTHAQAIVISHNHPNNSLLPSRDDINCTLALLSALQPLGVPLLDHVLVADQQAVSIRDLGYIAGNIWLAQAPEDKLLTSWLKDAPPL